MLSSLVNKIFLPFLLSLSVYCQAFIGGTPADSNTFPSSVIYIQNGCTATLISTNKILLAAHCVLPYQNTWLHQKNSVIRFHRSAVAIGSPAIESTITRIDIHPDWLQKIQSGKNLNQFITQKNTVDLAVLTISSISQKIASSIILPLNFNAVSINDEVIIGGYGCEYLDQPNRNPRYKYAWKSIAKINGNQFITGSKNLHSQNKSMACEGDSGGPVFSMINGKLSIVGVNSYVTEISPNDFITGHVRISLHKNWLLKAMR